MKSDPVVRYNRYMNGSPPNSVVFFRTENGREPVRKWLKALDRDDRKKIGEDIKVVQFR